MWEQRYENRGTDRIALSPDGTTLYAPELGAPKWVVADAATGAMITTIDKPGNPHNTQFSDDGSRVYFEAEGNTRTMSVVDAATRTIVKEIGPFGNMVRPFTFNGAQTLLFANINDFLSFEVADLRTGQVDVAEPGTTEVDVLEARPAQVLVGEISHAAEHGTQRRHCAASVGRRPRRAGR